MNDIAPDFGADLQVATAGLNQGQVTELLCEGKTGAGLCAAIQNEVRFRTAVQLWIRACEKHTHKAHFSPAGLCARKMFYWVQWIQNGLSMPDETQRFPQVHCCAGSFELTARRIHLAQAARKR
eukprot:COSAG06_NODE_4570_length_4137_cov_1.758791_4_plen_124_part_00